MCIFRCTLSTCGNMVYSKFNYIRAIVLAVSWNRYSVNWPGSVKFVNSTQFSYRSASCPVKCVTELCFCMVSSLHDRWWACKYTYAYTWSVVTLQFYITVNAQWNYRLTVVADTTSSATVVFLQQSLQSWQRELQEKRSHRVSLHF